MENQYYTDQITQHGIIILKTCPNNIKSPENLCFWSCFLKLIKVPDKLGEIAQCSKRQLCWDVLVPETTFDLGQALDLGFFKVRGLDQVSSKQNILLFCWQWIKLGLFRKTAILVGEKWSKIRKHHRNFMQGQNIQVLFPN